jgi:RNA polymerase sigma factor (sigma-70 family)
VKQDVFTELYRVHAPHVLRRARAMLGSDADAWEVVQDLFLELYTRPSAFDGRSTMSTYLFSATTHACLNRIRNRRTRARLLATYDAPKPSAGGAPDLAALSPLHNLVRTLDEPMASVALYYYVDDLSHDEIAKLVGCSRKHIGNLLARVVDAARALEATC